MSTKTIDFWKHIKDYDTRKRPFRTRTFTGTDEEIDALACKECDKIGPMACFMYR